MSDPAAVPAIVTAVLRPLDGDTDGLLEALRPAVEAAHAEAGCLAYALHRAEDGSVTLIEKWADRAALDAHSAGPATALLRTALAGRVAERPVVTRLVPVPVGATGRGLL